MTTNGTQYWERCARIRVPRALPKDKTWRGEFVITGTPQTMASIWRTVKIDTEEGRLGYFSNFSDHSYAMIIYHYKKEKTRVRKRVSQITKGTNVRVVWRQGFKKTIQ